MSQVELDHGLTAAARVVHQLTLSESGHWTGLSRAEWGARPSVVLNGELKIILDYQSIG